MNRRILCVVAVLLVGVVGLGPSVSGVMGRFVEVQVEAFVPWGILALGTWRPLDPALVTVDVGTLGEDAALAAAVALCDSKGADPSACALLSSLRYRLARTFRVEPLLGRAYRVRLTNLTDVPLGVVLSVDGLNSLGSAEIIGTAEDRKWILRPGETVRIAGWQVTGKEALAFRFGTPSQSHSSLAETRGEIVVSVYLPDPATAAGTRGTAAGEIIVQPTVLIPFRSATVLPVEEFRFDYGRARVALGLLCEETNGAGIRISGVVLGTTAELRGLREGDVITYADGRPVRTCADLQSLLSGKSPGDRIVLKVHRADRVFLLTLEIEE